MKKISILTFILITLATLGAANLTAQSRVNIDALNKKILDFVKSDKKFGEVVLNQTKLITQNLSSPEKAKRDYTRVTLEAGSKYGVLFLVDGSAVKSLDLACIFDKDAIEPHGEASGPSEIINMRNVSNTADRTFTVKTTAEFIFNVTTWEDLPKDGAFYTIIVVKLT